MNEATQLISYSGLLYFGNNEVGLSFNAQHCQRRLSIALDAKNEHKLTSLLANSLIGAIPLK